MFLWLAYFTIYLFKAASDGPRNRGENLIRVAYRVTAILLGV